MRVCVIVDTAADSLGLERYARELLARLIESDLVEEVVIAHSAGWTQPMRLRINEKQSHKARELIIPIPNSPFRKELRQLFIAPFLLNKLSREGIDIVHDLFNFAPFLLSYGRYKKVVTVHDIRSFLSRNMYPTGQRLGFYIRYKYILPLILARADSIIAISNNTKQDLCRHLGVRANKIRVVYHGIDDSYKPIEDPVRLNKVKSDYKLNYPFILGISTWGCMDNVRSLIESFKLLRKNIVNDSLNLGDMKLVFFGYFEPRTVSWVKEIGLGNDIVFLGYIPESDLAPLYSLATLFVYPSLYEGFGFPPLEAMACGTPTIVSDVSSLPEVVGDGALKVDPYDSVKLAKEIESILSNKEAARHLSLKGRERAAKFTWGETASETLKIYSDFLGKRR